MHLMCCPNYTQQQFQILINPVNAFCMQVPRKKRLDYSTVLVCSHSNGTTLCLLCIHYNRYQILILSHVPRPKKCSFFFFFLHFLYQLYIHLKMLCCTCYFAHQEQIILVHFLRLLLFVFTASPLHDYGVVGQQPYFDSYMPYFKKFY